MYTFFYSIMANHLAIRDSLSGLPISIQLLRTHHFSFRIFGFEIFDEDIGDVVTI